ncbi:uncharacterized protein N0V89_001586 [Didymosphaeria variabile]|uniref:Xylanolytic transcriptional activator regulatory domain-containing protein n=1 Tax=Didymosphaeria variabile TaxID=1932322 RepID=A0A9W8XZ09_9PLEO|nr:uncharacterized protein N0V89_001586 [Didymosphaeria variabile]KAJ4361017.1 hypothetical protein N0V89_001586 [Didymosphaeria variabile]
MTLSEESSPITKQSEEWTEKGLVAEAARQRQFEQVNARLGKLDFDGVEPELGLHLLSLHWNRQHHSFLITYRPAFMRDMACNGPYFSKLLLNAIYFSAAKFSPRHELRRERDNVRTAGWRFRERVRELLGGALDRSDITTIQALLIMTNSLFALGDERSAAWLYAGLAFRMIVDLGMHVESPKLTSYRKFSDEDSEIRRRVFWAAFEVVDKIQSLYQGRPVTIKESDTLVPIKFLDTFEEFEPWTPLAYSTQPSVAYPGSPSYTVSTFRYFCELSVILSDILSSIYTERSFQNTPGELSAKLETINARLAKWYDTLPGHLSATSQKEEITPPPHVLNLQALYHVLVILLHHPFITDGHHYHAYRNISAKSLKACATAANAIVQLVRAYDKAFSVRRAPYLISYATYMAATIYVRIAAKRTAGSDAHSSLGTCLAVFNENQQTNSAVRRANALVQNLMKRLGVTVPNTSQIHIDKNVEDGEHPDHMAATEHGSLSQEPGLQGLDIDSIIQSFVREAESQQANRTTLAGSVDTTTQLDSATVAPDMTSSTQQNNTGVLPYDYTATWGPPGQIQPQGEGMMSLDDLFYGFNSSALDSFPVTPMPGWETL